MEIELATRYKAGKLVLNEYTGSWEQPKGTNKLCCKNMHQVGQALNEDEATVDPDLLRLYLPFGREGPLWTPEEWPG